MNDTPNTPNSNDPLLTAYALGELDPQSADYQAIADKVADDPALHEQVEQIAQLGSQLKQSYDTAAGPGLEDAVLNNLVDASTAPIARIHRKPSLTRRLLPYAGVAACTALATAGVFIIAQTQNTDIPIAGDNPAHLDIENAADESPKQLIDQPITIKLDKTPLIEALTQISKAAGITINYDVVDPDDFGKTILHPINLDLTNTPARAALESALSQVNMRYPTPDYLLDYHITNSTTISVDKRQALSDAGLSPVMATAFAAIPLGERLQQTRAQLQRPVTLNMQSFPLGLALHLITEQTGVQLLVNWQGLELVGVDPDSLVTIKLKEVPGHETLKAILWQASADAFDDDKLGYRVAEGFIKISTLRDLKSDTETRVYDVRDLLVADDVLSQVKRTLMARVGVSSGASVGSGGGGLFGDDGGGLFGSYETLYPGLASGTPTTSSAPNNNPGNSVYDIRDLNIEVPNFDKAPGFDLNDALSNNGKGSGQGSLFGDSNDNDFDSYGEDLPSRQEMIDQVVELVNTTVGDPDEWLDEESTLTELNGNLIVKTTPENHEQLDQLLATLRLTRGKARAQQPIIEDIDNVIALMLKDIEQGLIDVEERREQRELERERRERFAEMTDNPFKPVELNPLSTFSVDVDTASYTYGRRSILKDLTLPQPDAVRIEEWVNYFDYGYTAPVIDHKAIPNGRLTSAALERIEAADETFVPFATDVEVVQCPWTEGNQLVRIGIQAMEVSQVDRPPAHLVFLLDVSGSMSSADKLGLVQQGMPMLLDQLNDTDKVSIVVYAGASGLVLEAAEAADKNKIKDAIAALKAGGSTAGGEGIKLAYDIAQKHFVTGGVNRVILCTDGDFNVGTSDTDELVELVKSKANPEAEDDEENKGVYLSVMGFGTGNLNDEMMEKITNAGNGNYHYIDSVNEAVKTMSSQAGGTLVTVAKDVKLQLEFNPAKVASYRLIGYENRILRDEDFNNDIVDAGDIGAGHSVTALYEIVPVKDKAEDEDKEPIVDDLRYQKPRGLAAAAELPELLTLKLRYKPVDAAAEQGTSRKVVKHVPANAVGFDKASEATRFSSSVAALGMILRGSPHKGTATTQWIVDTASNAKAHDPNGYRDEFIQLATQVGLLHVQQGEALDGVPVD